MTDFMRIPGIVDNEEIFYTPQGQADDYMWMFLINHGYTEVYLRGVSDAVPEMTLPLVELHLDGRGTVELIDVTVDTVGQFFDSNVPVTLVPASVRYC